ncbi:MAG: Cof-type HAD-IIB family hydrolase [Acidimicrobiaceae bacterium]|nr:Cof-type HAD-IIB family hydrolase [Acidimicrobiaceae bacterium]MDE0496769.1 Cof-type HAD-IIB family hydrolase [Acidimicrobiaceae bacterium]
MTTPPRKAPARPRAGLPRLAAFDVDGTLINRQGVLTERTASALRALAEAGVITALATGRPWPQAQSVVRQASGVSYAVCLNGAVVMDAVAGEQIAVRAMTHIEAIEAAEMARKLVPDVRLGLDMADGRHVWEHDFAPVMPVGLLADISVDRVDDALSAVDGPVLTWLVHAPSVDTLAIIDELSPGMPLGTEIRPSGLDVAEIAAAGVSKSAGLEIICQRYGFDAADVLAFGDGLNDIDMLRWAGQAVAMSNAPDSVRDAADRVAPSNEDDGVAAVVEAMLAPEGGLLAGRGGAFAAAPPGGRSDG